MPRHAAWSILRSSRPAPLRQVDRVAERRGLEGRDRALLRKLVGTEVRRRATLRALVQAFTSRKPSPDLAAHLRLGFVQLFFLDQVPEHAAVSETVRAAVDTLGMPKGRAVNRVLRDALRASRKETTGDPRCDIPGRNLSFNRPIFRDPEEHPLLWAEDALSLPAGLVKRFVSRYGEERAFELARGYLAEPPLSLVVRDGLRDEVRNALAADDIPAQPGVHERILVVPAAHAEALFASDTFRSGRLRVQGETALRAALLLGAREGEEVLDLCAAPGGKALALRDCGARLVALDKSYRRLTRLDPSIARVACDGTRGLGPAAEGRFDGVLADVPCSNTGVLGARPGARWRFGPHALRELTELQARLLVEASRAVRPGGRLVYSTCSLEPEENARRVRAFLTEHPVWNLEEEIEALPETGPEGPIDGGYAARLALGLR